MSDRHGNIILILSWTLVTCFLAFEFGRVYARTEMKKQYDFKNVKPAFGQIVRKK